MDKKEPQPQASTPASSRSSSHQSDSFFDFDFDFEALIDEDDPGFNVDSDTDPDNFSVAEHNSEATDDETDNSDSDSSSTHTAEPTTHLDALTSLLQTEFQSQPKSTQLILTHEVAQLFKSYENHGSAARLSAAIMAYLDGGSEVFRSTNHLVEVDDIDGFGRLVGRKEVERKVVERAVLKFEDIPVVHDNAGTARDDSDGQFVRNGKRKADDRGSERGASRERKHGPTGGFGDVDGSGVTRDSRPTFGGNGSSPRKVFPRATIDAMIDDTPMNGQGHNHYQDNFRNLLSRPGPPHQGCGINTTDSWTQIQQQKQAPQCVPAQSQPSATRSPTLTPTPLNDPRLHHLYSLTTDLETQALLLGPNPVIPFRPLADLKIAIPIQSTPRSQPQTQPQTQLTTPYPSDLIPTTTRILQLHSLSAHRFYTALIQKYTIPPSSTIPSPPPPPAALFRLAITARLHHDLQNTFQPMLEHEFAMHPSVRRLLKDLYANSAVGRHAAGDGHEGDGGDAGALNIVESTLVAKAAGVDELSVEMWWARRSQELFPWMALCGWVERREGEAIRAAREEGRF